MTSSGTHSPTSFRIFLNPPLRALEKMGSAVIGASARTVDILGIAACIARAFLHRRNWNSSGFIEVTRQIYYGGIGAIPFIAVVSLLIGAGLVFQLLYWLTLLGESGMADRFVVVVLIREIVPVMVALIFSGRSGMAILAEMGGLQQGGQVRALERSGIDTFEFLLLPRAIGAFISILGLSLLMLLLALLSGLTLSNWVGTSDRTIENFANGITAELSLQDLFAFIAKPLLISLALIAICGGRGLTKAADDVDVARQLPVAFTECVIAIFLISGLFVLLI